MAYQLAWQHTLRGESESVQRQLGLYTQALAQRIDRYRTLPEVLSLDPELRSALQQALKQPLTTAQVDHLNRKLEQANGASQASTLTLIDLHGRALAASNWRDARGNVGGLQLPPLCAAWPRAAAALRHWHDHRPGGLLSVARH